MAMVKSWPVLLLRAMSGYMVLLQQRSVWAAAWGHVDSEV